MHIFKYTLVLAIVLFSIRAFSQFTISGEFRPRAEYRNGYKDLFVKGQDNAFFIDQRTRLNLDFKNGKYAAKLVFQDVRVWGSTPQLVVADGALTSVHEAWGQVFLDTVFSIKFGRQEIAYDDHRIFGSAGWAQQARSHDALIFKYSKDDLKIDLGLAFNQDGASLSSTFYTVPASYKAFQYLWFNKKFGDITASILFLNNGKQGGTLLDFKTYYSQTIGTRLTYKKDALSANLALFYQGGREPNGITNNKINASLVGFDVGYKVNEKIFATLGFERQSGNSEVTPSTKNEAFTPFYGTNHKFNGFMDYFYVGDPFGSVFGSVGLQDIFLSLNFKPPKVTVRSDLHFFSSANDVSDPFDGTAMDKGLGFELDLVAGYPLVDGANLNLGYSQMFATSTMEALKIGDKRETQNWGWLMITLKPQFFTTKEN